MKIRIFIFLSILILSGSVLSVSAQVNTVFGQVTSSSGSSFAGGMSGNGRLIVFESSGDIATENPRNADRNREIFVFDYAQRRIFQITDTKSVLTNPNQGTTISNVKVDITNARPVISNDGKRIAFSSNATSSVAGSPVNGTNPGNFDGNGLTNATSGADQLDISSTTAATTLSNIIQPTTPSITRIRFTDSNLSITAFSVTVAGTDSGGASITENFTFANGLIQTGTKVFATITSVTLDSIAGNGATDTLNFEYGDGTNPLTTDANTEMWLFEFQNTLTNVDLTQGEDIPLTDLSVGTFTQITNTPASRIPVAGSSTQQALIASDNNEPSINDNGNVIAFISNRNLVGTGNQAPQDNPEIFTYVHSSNTVSQVTQTPRGAISEPQNNNVPLISGDGMRVMFTSNSNNPVAGMTGGDNTDLNEEIFYADLNASGAPSGTNKQVTTTSPTNPGEIVNVVNFGNRMSRDGKYIAFDSYADLTNEHSGENQTSFATFLFDADADNFRRISERSDADADAPGGDVARYPTFTDYVGGSPQTLVMGTRMNITSAGTVAANAEDGLNSIDQRPVQIYSYPLNMPAADATFTRITTLPPPPFLLASIQLYPSNSIKRIGITLPGSEIGTGNTDLSTEVYYLLQPTVSSESASSLSFATGATNIPVSNEPVPTPSPTPTPSPSPSPDPTPQTPAAVQGISPGMLATVNFTTGINQPVVARTGVGSLNRRFQLPMELAGVTMSIGGVTVGLKRVSQRQITFVVPSGLGAGFDIPFPVVINNNGIEIKGEIIIVAARPDIFRKEINPELNRAKIFNVTNRVQTGEPFDVTTLKYRGGVKVPTVLRMYLTGVQGVLGNEITIRIGQTAVSGTISNVELIEPGIYTLDFTLTPDLELIGDQPIVITILRGGGFFLGRLDNDAPRIRIL